MLAQAIEQEVADYLDRHAEQRDAQGHRMVVRNGYKPPRSLQTPLGPIEVHQPRIDDRRLDAQGWRIRFTSQVLPPYLRRTKSLEELLPWLYLKGISTGDYQEALQVLLGPRAPGLSASTIVRPYEQPDRVDLRDGAAADSSDQGLRQPAGLPDDGLPAGSQRRAVLAAPERRPAASGGNSGREIRRRYQGAGRLNQPSSTTFHNISVVTRLPECCRCPWPVTRLLS